MIPLRFCLLILVFIYEILLFPWLYTLLCMCPHLSFKIYVHWIQPLFTLLLTPSPSLSQFARCMWGGGPVNAFRE